jgi:putative transposase
MRAHEDQFKVSTMSVVLKVSRSGYYGWSNRKESKRSQQNRALLVEIEKVHSVSRQAYGAVKTWRELKPQGVHCGRHRVARLRRRAGIEARRKRRFRITTQSRAGIVVAENRLNQTSKPNQ